MSDLNARQEKILSLVRETGFVSIEALAQRFSVTPQTIRRDINELCDLALLQRYHGGAGLPSSVENIAYQTRQVILQDEKRRIANCLAKEVPDHASLMINIGTTTEEVAKALLDHEGLRVVTNNLNVASILVQNADFEVIIAGGLVRNPDRAIVGEGAVDTIRQFKADIAIIGISGIDADGTLLDFDEREVRVARAIVQNARRVFLAADHSKFGRSAMVRLGQLSDVDDLFTDLPPPEEMAEVIRQSGVRTHVASQSATHL